MSGPFGGGDNPFEGMPLLGDLMKMIGQQGPVSWDGARQLALSIAVEGDSEPNVDPLERIAFEQLARVAEIQVAGETGLATSVTGRPITLRPVARTQWVMATIDAYRPLFELMAGSLRQEPNASDAASTEQGHPSGAVPVEASEGAWLAQLMSMLSPMMLGMTAGSLVGHLATRSFGHYDLLVPRPPTDDLTIVIANLDAFGQEWSLDGNDLRLWVCLHELTHHAVVGVPHVRARLEGLLTDYVSAFESDPQALENRLGDVDPGSMESIQSFQQMMSDPEVILGAVQSDRQRELLPRIDALVAVVEGYVDHVMDRVGGPLISTYSMVTEAVRRRRVESSDSDRFVGRLFGLEVSQSRFDRGERFIDGVVERGGEPALDRLWEADGTLPTPAEVDAPGLWLARLEYT